MQAATLTQEYIAGMQEGGLPVLGGDELYNVAIFTDRKSAQVADVYARPLTVLIELGGKLPLCPLMSV